MPITHIHHDWQVRRDTGLTVYEECPQCHRRHAWQRGMSLEPIDRNWIETGQWSPDTPPHRPQATPHPLTGDPIDAFKSQRKG